MENFPSNSRDRVPKEEPPTEKHIQKVVEGDVIRRKKPLGTRFREMFFGEDRKSVVDYVVTEVLLPAMKDTIADAVTQGMERMIFGDARPPSRRGNRSSAFGNNTNVPVNYNRYSSSSRREERPSGMSRRARATHDFDEIILATRSDAEDVLDQLFTIVEKYEAVSVKDLYEMVGVEFHHTDEKWGWTDLRGATVTRISNGYLLNLPKTEPLD